MLSLRQAKTVLLQSSAGWLYKMSKIPNTSYILLPTEDAKDGLPLHEPEGQVCLVNTTDAAIVSRLDYIDSNPFKHPDLAEEYGLLVQLHGGENPADVGFRVPGHVFNAAHRNIFPQDGALTSLVQVRLYALHFVDAVVAQLPPRDFNEQFVVSMLNSYKAQQAMYGLDESRRFAIWQLNVNHLRSALSLHMYCAHKRKASTGVYGLSLMSKSLGITYPASR